LRQELATVQSKIESETLQHQLLALKHEGDTARLCGELTSFIHAQKDLEIKLFSAETESKHQLQVAHQDLQDFQTAASEDEEKLLTEKNSLRKDCAFLKGQVAELLATKASLEEEKDSMDKTDSELRSTISAQQAEVSKLSETVAREKELNAELQKKVNNLNADSAAKDDTIEELNSIITIQKTETDKAIRDCGIITAALQKLEREVADLSAELNQEKLKVVEKTVIAKFEADLTRGHMKQITRRSLRAQVVENILLPNQQPHSVRPEVPTPPQLAGNDAECLTSEPAELKDSQQHACNDLPDGLEQCEQRAPTPELVQQPPTEARHGFRRPNARHDTMLDALRLFSGQPNETSPLISGSLSWTTIPDRSIIHRRNAKDGPNDVRLFSDGDSGHDEFDRQKTEDMTDQYERWINGLVPALKECQRIVSCYMPASGTVPWELIEDPDDVCEHEADTDEEFENTHGDRADESTDGVHHSGPDDLTTSSRAIFQDETTAHQRPMIRLPPPAPFTPIPTGPRNPLIGRRPHRAHPTPPTGPRFLHHGRRPPAEQNSAAPGSSSPTTNSNKVRQQQQWQNGLGASRHATSEHYNRGDARH
jgi:uncharacterized coiled-coil protein SlyX